MIFMLGCWVVIVLSLTATFEMRVYQMGWNAGFAENRAI
jgi:hypothetical protein